MMNDHHVVVDSVTLVTQRDVSVCDERLTVCSLCAPCVLHCTVCVCVCVCVCVEPVVREQLTTSCISLPVSDAQSSR